MADPRLARNGAKPQPGTGPRAITRPKRDEHVVCLPTGLHPSRLAWVQAAIRAAHAMPLGAATSL